MDKYHSVNHVTVIVRSTSTCMYHMYYICTHRLRYKTEENTSVKHVFYPDGL